MRPLYNTMIIMMGLPLLWVVTGIDENAEFTIFSLLPSFVLLTFVMLFFNLFYSVVAQFKSVKSTREQWLRYRPLRFWMFTLATILLVGFGPTLWGQFLQSL